MPTKSAAQRKFGTATPAKEYSVQHDGCFYTCYKKKKRAYCYKEEKQCTPRPVGTTTFKQYLAALYPELQGAFALINTLVDRGDREAELITQFVNYVKPQNYVYASPRPIPFGMPHIKQIIPIGMSSDEFHWIDLVVTTQKLTPKEKYDYELSPMTPAAEHFFKISNLLRYKIMRPSDVETYAQALAAKQVSPTRIMQDMAVMAQEYFERRYKIPRGRYSATPTVAANLLEQLLASLPK